MKAVNLLPDARSGAPRKGRASRPSGSAPGSTAVGAAIVGVLGIVLAAVVLLVQAGNSVAQKKTDLQAAEQAATAAEQHAAALKPYGDFATIAAQRVETVRQLATSRFDWEQVLRDLARALPSDVTLRSINGTVAPGVAAGGTSGAGSGAGALRSALAVPALELSGCTTGQTDVARLMADLRGIQGVTRVSLAKSDKDTGSSAAATTIAGPNGSPTCRRKSPANFDLVVFFENDAAAAAAKSGATSPTGAAGGPTGATGPTGQSGTSTATPSTQNVSDPK